MQPDPKNRGKDDGFPDSLTHFEQEMGKTIEDSIKDTIEDTEDNDEEEEND